jgi:hypothetical protein
MNQTVYCKLRHSKVGFSPSQGRSAELCHLTSRHSVLSSASYWKIGVTLLAVAIFVGGQTQPVKKAVPPGSEVRQSNAPPKAEQPPQQPLAKNGQLGKQDCEPSTTTPSAIPGEQLKESFSELTLFLFASALALFVALLGWSDQIRGINRDTKELEARFLAETGIDRRDFLSVVRPKVQGEQLAALAKLLRDGRIQSKTKIDLLPAFKSWYCEWSKLERVSGLKYGLAITLTIAFFLAGLTSLFTHAADRIRLHHLAVRSEMLVLTLPLALVAILIVIIIYESKRERALRAYLDSLADEV